MANHEKAFDRLSKRFACGIETVHSSFVVGCCSQYVLAMDKGFRARSAQASHWEWPKSLAAFMESPDFETVVIEKRLLKPGSSLSDPSKLKRVTPVCTYLAEISMARGVTGGPSPFTMKFACPAPSGICMPVIACGRESNRIEKGEGEIAAVQRDLGKTIESTTRSVQDNCKQIGGKGPNTIGTLQFLSSDKSILEELCFVTYQCEKAGTGTAMCPPLQEVVVVGGKESVKTTCPQLNACIAAQVPRLPGYTQAELDAMPEDKRKETLRMLAEPAVPYKKPT